MSLAGALEAALVAVFPPRCVGCDALLSAKPQHGLCHACFEILEPNSGERCTRCDLPATTSLCAVCHGRAPAFDKLRASFVYGGPIVELVQAAKFHGREDLAAEAGRLLAEDREIRELVGGVTAIVPIPLSRARQRERGYNQAAIMARTLAKVVKVPVAYVLKRVIQTRPQSELPLAARRQNVARAFVAKGPLRGQLLIVDDVVTSGETAHAAAMALKEAGAEGVRVAALARAILRDS